MYSMLLDPVFYLFFNIFTDCCDVAESLVFVSGFKACLGRVICLLRVLHDEI